MFTVASLQHESDYHPALQTHVLSYVSNLLLCEHIHAGQLYLNSKYSSTAKGGVGQISKCVCVHIRQVLYYILMFHLRP